MQVIDLFSGIGGFSLAAQWMGWETVQFCEINPYCQEVLEKNFPGVPIHDDIKTLTREKIEKSGRWDPRRRTILVGGFPCQPYSLSGERRGNDDDRALWPEMLRVVREVRPDWVVGENVAGILSMDGGRVFEGILLDLEDAGYSWEVYVIPACGVGAPHRRDRVWIVAHADGGRREGYELQRTNLFTGSGQGAAADADGEWEPQQGGRERDERRWAEHGDKEVLTNTKEVGQQRDGRSRRRRDGLENENRVIGNTDSEGLEGYRGYDERSGERAVGSPDSALGDACEQGLEGGERLQEPARAAESNWSEHWYEVATRICGVANGLPGGVDGVGELPAEQKGKRKNAGNRHRLEGLGNAIVPQVVYEIFKAIQIYEDEKQK